MTSVVSFPLPHPPYDPAKRARLETGQALPEGVCRLFPIREAAPIPATPTTAFLRALAASLPPKAYTSLTSRLATAARDGDPSAMVALRIATGGQ